jgi:hypothetical protein
LELIHDAVTKDGLKSLSRCQKLHRLTLHGSSFSAGGISQLATLPVDDLSLADLSDQAALDLSGFKHLKIFGAANIKDGKNRLLDELARLKGIEVLRLHNCGVTDDDLAKVGGLGLKNIDLEGGPIRGPGLSALHPCRTLDRLRLSNCGVGDAALESIGRDLAGLRYLTITGPNQVQGPAFRSLAKCRGLKELTVADGVGNDAVAAEAATLPAVEYLNFSGCPQFTDTGLQSLTRLRTLKRLSISRCTKLTDAGIDAFRKARDDVKVDR